MVRMEGGREGGRREGEASRPGGKRHSRDASRRPSFLTGAGKEGRREGGREEEGRRKGGRMGEGRKREGISAALTLSKRRTETCGGRARAGANKREEGKGGKEEIVHM